MPMTKPTSEQVTYAQFWDSAPTTVKAALDSALTAAQGGTGKRYKIIAGVLRNTGAGWFVLDDATHTPIGITGITENANGSLTIAHNVGATVVSSLVVVPDETFASIGLWCGASVSASSSTIFMYAPLSFFIHFDTATINAPAHFSPEISYAFSTITTVITHPFILPDSVTAGIALLNATRAGSSGRTDMELTMSRTTDFTSTMQARTRLYARIEYDTGTSTWNVLGSNYAAGFSPTWSGSELRITVPFGNDTTGSTIVTSTAPYNARVKSPFSTTRIDVDFTTAAGVAVTTPDANTRCVVQRISENVVSGAVAIPLNVINFTAPIARVKCQNLSSASGNLWVLGLMEM